MTIMHIKTHIYGTIDVFMRTHAYWRNNIMDSNDFQSGAGGGNRSEEWALKMNEYMNEWIDLKAEIGLAQASKDSKTWDKECNVTFYYYIILSILFFLCIIFRLRY